MSSSLTAALLSPLSRSDGSCTYSHAGYTVACGINGPIEVQRKDELPEEATIDVVVRSAYGVGGIRERWQEDIIKKALRRIILVEAHPRTLVQVTLQVVAMPVVEDVLGGLAQADSNLPLLPALLQASMLALLSTSIPLSMTLTATFVAVDFSGQVFHDPSAEQLRDADSVHVFSISSCGDLLVVQSEGEFDLEIWGAAMQRAREVCGVGRNDVGKDGDVSMEVEEGRTLEDELRDTIREKIAREQSWKQSLG